MTQAISLLLISVAAGVVLLWIFSKTSDQQKIKTTKKRLQAHLLEMRLYGDDPKVVLRAQRDLFWNNAKYFALMLRPAVFATLPMVLLLIVMDGFYGKRPIGPGEEALVTVQMAEALPPDGAAPQLVVPEGVAVETAAVRALSERQVSWRIQPERELSGELRIVAGGGEVSKHLSAGGAGMEFLMGRRVRSWIEWVLYPGESRIGSGPFEWVEVGYPAAEVSFFGLATHWLVWFLIFSMAAALLLKNRFKVTI